MPKQHPTSAPLEVVVLAEPAEGIAMPDQHRTSDLLACRIAVGTAVVAATFSLVVAALLVYDVRHRAMIDPSQTSAQKALLAALEKHPDDKSIPKDLRKLDQESRDEYFRQRAFTLKGAVLLCGGIIVFLAAATWAVALRQRPPQPQPATTPHDWEASWTPVARWTVGGLFVVLAAAAVGAIVPFRSAVTVKPDVQVAGDKLPTPSGRRAGGETLPSRSGKVAGGSNLPSPSGRGAGGEGGSQSVAANSSHVASTTPSPTPLRSPSGKAVGSDNLPSPSGRGAGGEGGSQSGTANSSHTASTTPSPTPLPSPSGTAVGSDKLPSPSGRGAGGEGGSQSGTANSSHIVSTTPSPTPPPKTNGDLTAGAWPRFRGRDGSGISPYTNVPDDWDGPSGKNIVWKSPLLLPGNSSPIIVAGRIFFTGADEKRRQVYCLDAKYGKLLWQRDVPATPQGAQPMKEANEDSSSGYASCTMASDGRYVAAIFANGDLAAYDLDGKLAWSQGLGVPENPYGHAASLAVYNNLLLVPFDQATPKAARSKLRALDFATGHTVWEQARAVASSWTTPIVIRVAGREQVVTAACPWVITYDPAGGKELWRVKVRSGDPAPSPVCTGNVVIAAVNDSAPVVAIRADGSGDVTASHVLWQAEDNTPDICSPLATEEFVFLLASGGIVTCYDAHKGEKLWEEDLGDFKCKSSPSLVGKQLYVFGESGKCWILAPTRAGVKRVRQTDLGEGCTTCPAFQDGRMYVRGKKNLFCIGTR